MEPRYLILKINGEYRVKDNKKSRDSTGRLYRSLRSISNLVEGVSKREGKPRRELFGFLKIFMGSDEVDALEKILAAK